MIGRGDWDLRFPAIVLYAGPLALALFCLTLSQAGASVFHGFEEHEPATLLSSALMVTCIVIALAGARRSDLPNPIRNVGAILAVVATLAVLDENLLWHESLGRFIRHEVSSLPRSVTFFADDVIILMGAIVGGFILYRSIRYVAAVLPEPAEWLRLLPYLGCVVVFAVVHGLLDILGHGDKMVDRLWPGLSEAKADDLVDRISYFEEICKLWAEWFVILLLLRLLHAQRGPLLWSMLVAVGSGLAVVGGVWGLNDPAGGIPFLTLGQPLGFLRNVHALFALSWVWTAWMVAAWVVFGRDRARLEMTGLLYVVPLAPVLGALVDAQWLSSVVALVAYGLTPNAFYDASVARHGLLLVLMIAPGFVAGLVAGLVFRRSPWLLGAGVAIASGVVLSWRSPSVAMITLMAVTGIVVVGSHAVGRKFRVAALTGGVMLLALLSASPWCAVAALGWAVFVWARESATGGLQQRVWVYVGAAAVQFAVCLAVVVATSAVLMPNHDWKPDSNGSFELLYQPFDGRD